MGALVEFCFTTLLKYRYSGKQNMGNFCFKEGALEWKMEAKLKPFSNITWLAIKIKILLGNFLF